MQIRSYLLLIYIWLPLPSRRKIGKKIRHTTCCSLVGYPRHHQNLYLLMCTLRREIGIKSKSNGRTFRRSSPEVFLENNVLKICNKFSEKHPCPSVISINLFRHFIKITLRHGCSLVTLLHICRTPLRIIPLGGCFWTFDEKLWSLAIWNDYIPRQFQKTACALFHRFQQTKTILS